MTFSRMDRNDRRRRIVRELSASGSVNSSPRPKRQSRDTVDREGDAQDDALRSNAGYSLEVRHACKQRLAQFIPIRPASWAIYATSGWLVWVVLLSAHFVTQGRHAPWAESPFFEIFHLRHTHSIANWVGTQLWMLTGLTCFLVYRFRKHRLDDYRATYRIWLALVALSIFCSVDASSSLLYRLGWSIDPWCRSELGYPGWSIVFIGFAVVVGFVALRLLNEIKSSPLSVVLWLIGLIAWGVGAALGTGLIHTTWSQLHLDLLVGGAWLGGILTVWLSALTFLRHVYIQAQRRFGAVDAILPNGFSFKLPSIHLPLTRHREANREPNGGQTKASSDIRIAKTAAIERDIPPEEPEANQRKKGWTTWLSRNGLQDKEPTTSAGGSEPRQPERHEKPLEPTAVRASTPSAAPTIAATSGRDPDSDERESKPSRLSRLQFWKKRTGPKKTSDTGNSEVDSKNASQDQPSKPNRGLGSFMTKSQTSHLNSSEKLSNKVESRPPDVATTSKPKTDTAPTNSTEKTKESMLKSFSPSRWMRLLKRKPKLQKVDQPTPSSNSKGAKNPNPRGRFFGLFDGLKLKPPNEEPPNSSANTTTNPKPISNTAKLPSTAAVVPNDHDDIDYSDRSLSRAERKKLRREQNRRAA